MELAKYLLDAKGRMEAACARLRAQIESEATKCGTSGRGESEAGR